MIRILLVVAVALLAVRLAAPLLLTWAINRTLQTGAVYRGHIGGVSLALIRGAYTVHDVHLTVTRGDGVAKPLLDIERIRLALSWADLLHGRMLASLEVERPVFTVMPSGPANTDVALPQADGRVPPPAPPSEQWQDGMRSILPFRIDNVVISRGVVRYLDDKRDVDLRITQISAALRGIVGGREAVPAPASCAITGLTTGDGRLHVDGTFEPWERWPTFALRVSLEQLYLPALNPSTRHLDGFAFRSGVFSAYCELSAHDGDVFGSLKPLFTDLAIARFKATDGGGATNLFWQAVIATGEAVLPNDGTDALAARIPITGTIDQPTTDVWTVVGSSLRNAFFAAIMPGFEARM